MRKRSLAAAVATATTLLVPALAATPANAASSFHFTNDVSWKCIAGSGTNVFIDACGGSASHKKTVTFQVKWGNHLVNVASGKCLDIALGSNKKVNSGDYVVQKTCSRNAANQKWDITGGTPDKGGEWLTIMQMSKPHLFISEKGATKYSKVIVEKQGYPVPDRQLWFKTPA
ncbi:RICIN domain-containing protein [Actinoallomurus sp. CA-150999]|uniref:RICIN domain-containing protein n=1 Tax=Actinoallomurus sp. CA-150999 TaxID=3239887 RepID=UPI003D90ADBE